MSESGRDEVFKTLQSDPARMTASPYRHHVQILFIPSLLSRLVRAVPDGCKRPLA